MSKFKVREIIEAPWVILSYSFWVILGTFRGLKMRYLTWRISRLDLEKNRLKESIDDIDEEQETLRKSTE